MRDCLLTLGPGAVHCRVHSQAERGTSESPLALEDMLNLITISTPFSHFQNAELSNHQWSLLQSASDDNLPTVATIGIHLCLIITITTEMWGHGIQWLFTSQSLERILEMTVEKNRLCISQNIFQLNQSIHFLSFCLLHW